MPDMPRDMLLAINSPHRTSIRASLPSRPSRDHPVFQRQLYIPLRISIVADCCISVVGPKGGRPASEVHSLTSEKRPFSESGFSDTT
jgi:hypothetical protein